MRDISGYMAGWSDLQTRGRSWLVSGALLAVGVAVGYALPQSNVSPKSETGTVSPAPSATSGPGTMFVFKTKSGSKQTFRFVESTPWQVSKSGKWNWTGIPPCLTPQTGTSSKVTLGVVNIHAVDTAPGRTMVAWVECYG
jgi:hypothetical protein